MNGNGTREITYLEAVREALSQEMRRDAEVFLLGEDIGVYGGAFGVTRGMLEEFGAGTGARHAHLRGGHRRRGDRAPR